ncbi:hypothetical protein M8J77_024830 [Diaphorina citri]|nr:hypothetical protein M8J77_024830 [Diaphorina citri]
MQLLNLTPKERRLELWNQQVQQPLLELEEELPTGSSQPFLTWKAFGPESPAANITKSYGGTKRMQPADAAVSRRMNISWYAAKWRRHALTQISLRQMRGQFTSQITGEERFDEKEEDTESK